MQDIVWGDVLSVGVDEIDADHQRLIGIFNILNQAVRDGESSEYLAAVVEELINCTVWHFSHEERLMLKYSYDDMKAHKEEHRELIESARELQQEIQQAKADMTEKHIEFLERWLTGHILTSDMRMGDYLYQAM